MSDAEDRSQAPSPRRRQEAREQGMVARSPELTAAVGLLVAVGLLGFLGPNLAAGLLGIVREPFQSEGLRAANFDAVVAQVRSGVLQVVGPLAGVFGGVALAMVAAHQLQTGGIWAPSLITPDVQRLLSLGGGDWLDRATRGAWGVLKGVVVAGVTVWLIRAAWQDLGRLGELPTPELVAASVAILRRGLLTLGGATLALGALDYLMQRRRVETLLQMTPDQHREEQKAVDGDPTLKARRSRLAKSWRTDPAELLAGANLILTGPGNLAVILGGGPPPNRVIVRSSARGASGGQILAAARRKGLRVVTSPDLAQHLAKGAAQGGSLPPRLADAMAQAWTT